VTSGGRALHKREGHLHWGKRTLLTRHLAGKERLSLHFLIGWRVAEEGVVRSDFSLALQSPVR